MTSKTWASSSPTCTLPSGRRSCYGQTVRVWTWVSRLGNKSIRFEYRLEDAETGQLFSEADTVMVTYDYHADQSIRIPEAWREKIAAFEGIPHDIVSE